MCLAGTAATRQATLRVSLTLRQTHLPPVHHLVMKFQQTGCQGNFGRHGHMGLGMSPGSTAAAREASGGDVQSQMLMIFFFSVPLGCKQPVAYRARCPQLHAALPGHITKKK